MRALILSFVIGYDPTAVPEPGTLAILTTCLIVLGALRGHLTRPPSDAVAAYAQHRQARQAVSVPFAGMRRSGAGDECADQRFRRAGDL
jgi:hypothetical protein